MEWKSIYNLDEMLAIRNSLCAVRCSDNVLDPEDWGVDVITVKDGKVVKQINVYDGAYQIPNMVGWDLTTLYTWLKEDWTGSHPECYNEIRVIEKF